MMANSQQQRSFLFLQGPLSPFFKSVAKKINKEGYKTWRINLCAGDALFWRLPNSVHYRGKLADWYDYVSNFLIKNRITDLVLLGDSRPHHQIAIQAAKDNDVQITVTELGYIRPDWITLERNGLSSLSHFPTNPKKIRSIANDVVLKEEDTHYTSNFQTLAYWAFIYQAASLLFSFMYPHYHWHSVYHPFQELWGWVKKLPLKKHRNKHAQKVINDLLDSGHSYFVLPLQMQGDYQIRKHSPYHSIHDVIHDTIKSFSKNTNKQTRLVIKQHPLDNGLVNWLRFTNKLAKEYGVADRVLYIDGGNLNELLKSSLGVVTVNSSVGTLALELSLPVITLGAAIFDINGLTFQGELDDFWHQKSPPDPALVGSFIKALKGTIQVQGGFYSKKGLVTAVNNTTNRLINENVSEPGGFMLFAPRQHRKSSMSHMLKVVN